MPHKLKVQFSGRGTQAIMYIVDQALVDKLQKNAEDGHPESGLEIVENGCLKSELLCLGIDEDDHEFSVTLDGAPLPIIKYGYYPTDEDFSDYFSCDREEALTFGEEEKEDLGEGLSIEEGLSVVVVTTEYDLGNLYAEMDIDSAEVKASDLKVRVIETDCPTDYSYVSYHLGLLDGVEYDARQLVYKDQTVDFQLDFQGGGGGGIYLIGRDEEGMWGIDPASSDLFSE